MLELVVGRDSPGAPTTSLWFSVPAVAILVLPLFARRRFPFAAPAAYWLLATALTYVDGVLIPFIGSLGVVGLAAAFLLGNLRDERKAGLGLAIVLGCMVVVVSNIPGAQSGSDLIFIPLRFVVAWIAGYALRERSEQAEAAEMRATLAERERRRRRCGPCSPSGSERRRRGSPWPRSEHASHASSTTSSRTRSA